MGRGLSRKLDLVFTTFIEVTGLITTGASRARIVTPILVCACEILGGKAAFAILGSDGKTTRIAYSGGRRRGRQAVQEEPVEMTGSVARLCRTNKPMLLVLADSSEIRALAGGTARAAADLVEAMGGRLAGCAFLIELRDLKGRNLLDKYDVFSVMDYD